MRIEPARPDQYDAICAVITEGDTIHEEHLPDVFCRKSGAVRPRDFLLERMRGPASAIFVAVEDADVVGVLGGALPPSSSPVPKQWALAQGATAMDLNVWSFNASAKRLYERLGYVTRRVHVERSLDGLSGQERGAARPGWRPNP